MATEDDILRALERIPGPDGEPISRAVSGINFAGAKAFVSLAGDPARPKESEAARLAAQETIERVSGIERAIVSLTAEHKPAHQAPAGPASPRSIACDLSSPSRRAKAASANRRWPSTSRWARSPRL